MQIPNTLLDVVSPLPDRAILCPAPKHPSKVMHSSDGQFTHNKCLAFFPAALRA
ncbi:hypothetical protein BABINDRAFT_163574 [Babjeviella inositovora NRRL Y-12698]|uniref:Uncharacterized protein n=1 Tax=Babjeviella inositovora NRRL Y-12698 TaxID=984486 RepID=A0A1E3QJX7_9ASCO|nr:uncharacterized protein BABINDRAFT_163574 [Babjeviella inositovora NRRL Y-12698]ODQ77307.1 hypothetical protein BABINDRAFT_163574 [Babjeviella inositovora NRRL Y-12698]